jgi:hypothetical protein
MTPNEYRKRYRELPVPLDDGTTEMVRVDQYRLNGMNYQAAAHNRFESALADHGIGQGLRVVTETGTVLVDPAMTQMEDAFKRRTGLDLVFQEEGYRGRFLRVDTRVVNWSRLTRLPFLGKGAPEAFQVVLQLARRWGLAPNLQAYADAYLGLDCNGFVGNYFWHVRDRRPWTDLGLGDLDLGPEAEITEFLPENRCLKEWDDLDTSQSYVLGLVNGNGQVIPGGKGGVGHIVITEPGEIDVRVAPDGSQSIAVWAIESTPAHTPDALCEGWYSCRNAGSVRNKVFQMEREAMNAYLPGSRRLPFKIAPVNP